MFGFMRWTLLITAVVVSAIFAGVSVGIAQSPSPASPVPDPASPDDRLPPNRLPELTLPQLPLPQIPLPPDPASAEPAPSTLKKFIDMLQRNEPAAATGDSKLDELSEILGEMGSVLDGSSLDPSLDIETAREDSQLSARALAAELLLRTARKLEQISPSEPSRRQLVIQMRGEAVKLLTQ